MRFLKWACINVKNLWIKKWVILNTNLAIAIIGGFGIWLVAYNITNKTEKNKMIYEILFKSIEENQPKINKLAQSALNTFSILAQNGQDCLDKSQNLFDYKLCVVNNKKFIASFEKINEVSFRTSQIFIYGEKYNQLCSLLNIEHECQQMTKNYLTELDGLDNLSIYQLIKKYPKLNTNLLKHELKQYKIIYSENNFKYEELLELSRVATSSTIGILLEKEYYKNMYALVSTEFTKKIK